MLRATSKIFILGVLLVLTGLRPAFAECTESNPSDCHIGSAGLEINLGPLPVDNYLDHSNNRTPPILPTNNCPVTSSIRSCIINYLKGYKSQGVTGVRFQFGLGGGGFSTAFDVDKTTNPPTPHETISRKWLNNLQIFFSDLARIVGIKNITPTPNLSAWWGDWNFTSVQTVTSCGQSVSLLFLKWLPYGLNAANGYPDCWRNNNGYEDAHDNSINFWGWQPFFNLMNSVLSKAAAQGLTVEELDVNNEIDLLNFTVQGRLIYDNKHSTDVFGTLRNLMVKYYGTGADDRVTFSTYATWATSDGYDCGSVYGDTAMITRESELTAAYADGGLIGIPGGNFDESNGLPCAGDTTGMFTFPHSYSQPTINDIHAHICIFNPSAGRCYDPQLDNLDANYGSATARNLYGVQNDNYHGGIWLFLDQHGLTSHKVILGEVNHTQTSVCDGYDKSMAFSNVNGFHGYDDGNSTSSWLYQNAANKTVFRVWENDQDLYSCYAMPNTISPPYSP